MNKEKQIEQLELAIKIIREGLEWEWKNEALEIMDWTKARDGLSPSEFCHDEYEIRIKPQPDPYAELKKAHAAGKVIQSKCINEWADVSNPNLRFDYHIYRIKPEPIKPEPIKPEPIKPEPIKVTLGPEDVPPGSVFRSLRDQPSTKFWTVSQVWDKGFYLRGEDVDWHTAKASMEINRSISLTGKWDASAWEPCYKEVENHD